MKEEQFRQMTPSDKTYLKEYKDKSEDEVKEMFLRGNPAIKTTVDIMASHVDAKGKRHYQFENQRVKVPSRGNNFTNVRTTISRITIGSLLKENTFRMRGSQ